MTVAMLQPLPEVGERPSRLTAPVEIAVADETVAVKAQITMHVSPQRRHGVGDQAN